MVVGSNPAITAMKERYCAPIIEIDAYKVEVGFGGSSSPLIIDPTLDPSGCNCKAWDCTCSRRSECRGSGVGGCNKKDYISISEASEMEVDNGDVVWNW